MLTLLLFFNYPFSFFHQPSLPFFLTFFYKKNTGENNFEQLLKKENIF